MRFANNLKLIRKSLRLTQGDLARIMKVSQRTISHYEHGDSEPDLIIVCRLAYALNLSVEQLLGYEPSRDNEKYTELKELTMKYIERKKKAEEEMSMNYPL